MIKYKASQIIERAKSLADISNTNFITWGDCWQMLNSSYRKIYQDMINAGDLNYLHEIRLLTAGTSEFKLPDDFYQLAMLSDEYGNEIPLLPLASNISDWGYRISNGNILLQNVRGDVVLKYYPVPDTISHKKERTAEFELDTQKGINSAFGNNLLIETDDGAYSVIDISTREVKDTFIIAQNEVPIILGRDQVMVVTKTNTEFSIYYKDGTKVKTSDNGFMLTTDGRFIETPTTLHIASTPVWCNNDATAIFYYKLNIQKGRFSIHFVDRSDPSNPEDIDLQIERSTIDKHARVIYWNSKWAMVTSTHIIYSDGTWETTDASGILLKCDDTTGYGYLVETNTNKFVIEGWTPDTLIDYPNNILFDLTAYDLAIQFRIKQNADATQLKTISNQLENTYWASITNDNDNFVTIRNVNKNYTRWSWY